jgi:hypothetical protein
MDLGSLSKDTDSVSIFMFRLNLLSWAQYIELLYVFGNTVELYLMSPTEGVPPEDENRIHSLKCDALNESQNVSKTQNRDSYI